MVLGRVVEGRGWGLHGDCGMVGIVERQNGFVCSLSEGGEEGGV